MKCESWSDFIQQVVIHPKWNPKFPTHQETEIKLFRATNIDGGDLRRDRNAQERTRALADSDAYVHSLEEWNRGGQKGPMPRGMEAILVLHASECSTGIETYVPKTHTRVITSLNSNITPVTAIEELIENSIEATWNLDEPEISVEVDAERGIVRVRDNGCGMTRESLKAYSEIGVDRKTERMKTEAHEEVTFRLFLN